MLLQNGAILIADAHENEQRKGFWEFLQALKKGKISTPQLILMGDIFDLLIGEISATHEFAKPYIELLEELALKIEIIYLEGNHDFNLSCFFKRVKIFNLQEQPIKLNLHTSKGNNLVLNNAFIKLAHGDIFLPPLLQFTLKTLRNHYLLIFLNFLNLEKIDFVFIFIILPLLMIFLKKELHLQFVDNAYNDFRIVVIASFFTALFYAFYGLFFTYNEILNLELFSRKIIAYKSASFVYF
ncbi:metallophosphoesterase, partial [Campylobacter jejuni]